MHTGLWCKVGQQSAWKKQKREPQWAERKEHDLVEEGRRRVSMELETSLTQQQTTNCLADRVDLS